MADISMCLHKTCPKSNSCYRFLAPVNNEWQSFMKFENICTEGNEYKWYWEYKQEVVIKEGGDT